MAICTIILLSPLWLVVCVVMKPPFPAWTDKDCTAAEVLIMVSIYFHVEHVEKLWELTQWLFVGGEEKETQIQI
jgi:hypothetical protein